jgi:hypothetical protein
MTKGTNDIIIPLMEFLRDKEFHSLTNSILHLQKALKLSIKEKNDYYEYRNRNSEIIKLTSTKFYSRVADAVHVLRYAELIDDFGGKKGGGKFKLNENGYDFLENDNIEMQEKTETIFEEWKNRKKK